MISLAFVGGNYEEQLRTNPDGLAGVKVVWSGSSVKAFQNVVGSLEIDVLVLNLDELGPEPVQTVRHLLRTTGAELVIVTYSYARREMVQSLHSEQIRVLQGPLPLAALRSQMLSLIVRNILTGDRQNRPAAEEAGVSEVLVDCPACGSRVPAKRLRRAG